MAIINHFLSDSTLSRSLLPARYINTISNIRPRLNKLISQTSRITIPTSGCSAAQSNSAVTVITPIKMARTINFFIQELELFSDIVNR